MNARITEGKYLEYLNVMCFRLSLPETEYLFNDILENPGLLIPSTDPKDSSKKLTILINSIDSGRLSVADSILKGAASLIIVPNKETDPNTMNLGPKQIVLRRHHNDFEAYWLENGVRRKGYLYESDISDIKKELSFGYWMDTSTLLNQDLIKKITLKLGCTHLLWQSNTFLDRVDPFFCGNANDQLYGFLYSTIINVYHALITLEFYQSQNRMNEIMIDHAGNAMFLKSHYDLLYWIDPDVNSDESENRKRKPMLFKVDEECDITSDQIEQYKNIDVFFFMKLAYKALLLKNTINDANASIKNRSLAFEALGDFYFHICYMESYSIVSCEYALNCALGHYVCAKQLKSSRQIDEKIAYTEISIQYHAELHSIQFDIYKHKRSHLKEIDKNASKIQYIITPTERAIDIIENTEGNVSFITRYKKNSISDSNDEHSFSSEKYTSESFPHSDNPFFLFHFDNPSSSNSNVHALSCNIS